MAEDLDRDGIIGLLESLGSERDADVVEAAREIHARVTAAGVPGLLAEKPKIKGIALPGMSSGSPGMPGPKTGRFIIYTISDGEPTVFMEF